MSLFPFVNVPDNLILEADKPLPLYREVAWDFNLNTPIIENGEVKIVEKNEAIKVWIYKAINTNRYEHLIHSWDYGSELSELIGQKFSKGLTESEASRYIKECLEINPYIKEITVSNVTFIHDLLSATIKVKTIYGEVELNV